MLQSKCLSALLGHTLSGNNQFKYFFTWIVLFMWLTLTLFWSVHQPYMHTHTHVNIYQEDTCTHTHVNIYQDV